MAQAIGNKWVTSFEDAGYEKQVAGLTKCMVNFSGFWNAVSPNMHDVPLAVTDGNELLGTKLYTNGLTSSFWNFPLLSIISASMTARVDGKVEYRVRGKANGIFAYPVGA